MPDRDDLSAGKRSTSLALDPFVVTAPGASAFMTFPEDLSRAQHQLIVALAQAVPYLGRAESIVELALADPPDDPENYEEWLPLDGSAPRDGHVLGAHPTMLLVPDRPLDPDSVHARTASLQSRGRTLPPSTSWHAYLPPPRQEPQPVVELARPDPIRVLQFAVTGRGRPRLRDAALVATQLRAVANSRNPDSPTLHGHAEDGAKRRDQHRHAHWLVVNDGRSGPRIDRVILWVPEGLPAAAAATLAAMDRIDLSRHDYVAKRLGSRQIRIAVEVVGDARHLDPRLAGPARHWRSLTPVTTPRHRKKQAFGRFFEDVVRRELSFRNLPSDAEGVRVEVGDDDRPTSQRARVFHRSRAPGGPPHQGSHVRLEFTDPVDGPLVLGSLAHFGLGLMVADE